MGTAAQIQSSKGDALWLPVSLSIAVAVWCVSVEWMFRADLQAGYMTWLLSDPLPHRILHYMGQALYEGVVFRGLFMLPLAWVLGLFWPGDGRWWLAICATQGLILLVFAGPPLTSAAVIVHTLIRYVLPGGAWGWLCWKRGLSVAIPAHMGTHLVYQPLLALVFTGAIA